MKEIKTTKKRTRGRRQTHKKKKNFFFLTSKLCSGVKCRIDTDPPRHGRYLWSLHVYVPTYRYLRVIVNYNHFCLIDDRPFCGRRLRTDTPIIISRVVCPLTIFSFYPNYLSLLEYIPLLFSFPWNPHNGESQTRDAVACRTQTGSF